MRGFDSYDSVGYVLTLHISPPYSLPIQAYVCVCVCLVSRSALVAPQMGRMDSGNPTAFEVEPYSFMVVQFTKKKSESS